MDEEQSPGDPRAVQQNLDMKLVPVSPTNVTKLRQPPRWKLKQSIFSMRFFIENKKYVQLCS